MYNYKKNNIIGISLFFILLILGYTSFQQLDKPTVQAFSKHFLQKPQNNTTLTNNNNQNKTNEETIIKPKIDEKDYEIFTTKNGIKTLLISTDQPQDYGASLTIKGVGSYQDGNQTQGISHFVEHLVFTGSKNYPKWDMVQDITLKGGVFNGLTMSNTTQYPVGFSDLNVLENTLKQIVDFIINPGLAEDVINKEIYAISAEYHLDIVDSTQKIEYIWKLLSDPNSRFHDFDVGDINSLKSVLKNPKILSDYIQRTYVPENMFLVIYTSKVLKQETKQKLSDIFDKIPKRKTPEKYQIPPVFNKDSKQCFVKLKDTSKVQELTLSFNTEQFNSYSTKSLDYVQGIFQAGGQNGFCQYILRQKWATQCQIGAEQLTRYEVMQFAIITLTKLGAGKVSQIIQYLFKFIESMKAIGIKEEYYNVMKKMSALQFEYQEEQDIFDLLTNVGLQFSWNPNKNVLFQEFNYEKFDRQEIQQILNQLVLENSIFILRSSDFKGYFESSQDINNFLYNNQDFQENELWDFQYNIYKFSEQDIELLENQLPLPKTNFDDILEQKQFLKMPKIIKNKKQNKTEQKNEENQPQLLISNEQGNLWFYQDLKFKMPYTAELILLDHKNGIIGQKEQFYLQFAAQGLNTFFQADLFFPTQRGMEIVIYMPSNLQQTIAYAIAQQYRKYSFQQEDVNYILETIQNNFYYQRETYSLQESMDYLKYIWCENSYTQDDFMNQLISFDFQDFNQWFKQYQKQTHLEVLIMGNISQNHALNDYKQLVKTLDFKSIDSFASYKSQSINVFKGSNILQRFSTEYDKHNQSIINLYQLPHDIDSNKMQLVLNYFNLYFSAYSFDFLRSINQLGYIAEAAITEKNGVQHLFVLVVGYRFSPQDMDQKIEELFQFVYEQLQKAYKDNDIINLENYVYKTPNSPKFIAFSDQLGSFWEEIVGETYFGIQNEASQKQKKPEKIKTIKNKDLLQLYQQWFQQNNNKISVQLVNPYVSLQLQTNIKTQNYNGIKQNQVYNTVNDLLKDNKFDQIQGQHYPIDNIQN